METIQKNNKNKNSDDSEEENKETKPSYTYWKRDADKPFSTEFQPQKSDPNLSENNNSNNSNTYGSAWNKAGTWEEKHFLKNQIEDFFNNSISKKNLIFNNLFLVEKISNYHGDVLFFIYI